MRELNSPTISVMSQDFNVFMSVQNIHFWNEKGVYCKQY